MAEIEKVKCLIIGSGPAGYTAAIYADVQTCVRCFMKIAARRSVDDNYGC